MGCPRIFLIPVPRLFSHTKFYRYRFRDFFPVPNFSDTGSDTTRKNEQFPVPVPRRYRYPLQIFKIPKFVRQNSVPVPNFFRYRYRYFFRYQIFPIPVPRLFSGTKFFRYRFRYFFPVPIFSDTGSDTTKTMKNSQYRYVTLCHNNKNKDGTFF